MFDLGFWEIAVVCVIALLVVGPSRLPALARNIGLWVGRARRMVDEVKRDIDREVRESELQEVKKEAEDAARNIGDFVNKDVVADAGAPSADGEKK